MEVSYFIKLVMDPTKLEKMIIDQIEERKINNEKRNLENKLSPEEKKEKKKKKYAEGNNLILID